MSADRVDSAWEALDSLGPVDLLGEARGRIASEIKLLLHASRDSLRNHGVDTTTQSFSLTNDGGYSAEAFGLVRALHLLGFGSLSGDSEGDVSATNLQAWYSNIQQQVLLEENFNGSNVCEYCLSRYGKDANGKVDAASLDAAREAFREIRAAITQGPHA